MYRVMLSGYLAFVTAAGPCLCCCALAQAAARTAAHDAAKSACHRKCCHSGAPCEHGRKSSTPTCPNCPKGSQSTCCGLLPPVANKVSMAFAEWLTLLAAAYDSASLEPAAASFELVVADGVRVHRPFLETGDLLDAHHKLRC